MALKHGGWPVWERLAAQQQGELMAHEAHKNMRDHYYYDKRTPGDPMPKPKVPMPMDVIRNKFFGGGAATL